MLIQLTFGNFLALLFTIRLFRLSIIGGCTVYAALDGQRSTVVAHVNVEILLLNSWELSAHDVLIVLFRKLSDCLAKLLIQAASLATVWVFNKTEERLKVVEEEASKRHVERE
jgi:hypothetical protein